MAGKNNEETVSLRRQKYMLSVKSVFIFKITKGLFLGKKANSNIRNYICIFLKSVGIWNYNLGGPIEFSQLLKQWDAGKMFLVGLILKNKEMWFKFSKRTRAQALWVISSAHNWGTWPCAQRRLPHLRPVAATCMLVSEAEKLSIPRPLTIRTSHSQLFLLVSRSVTNRGEWNNWTVVV